MSHCAEGEYGSVTPNSDVTRLHFQQVFPKKRTKAGKTNNFEDALSESTISSSPYETRGKQRRKLMRCQQSAQSDIVRSTDNSADSSWLQKEHVLPSSSAERALLQGILLEENKLLKSLIKELKRAAPNPKKG